MVYKNHQFVREALSKDSSVWPDDIDPAVKEHIKKLRRSHPRIPYTLEVECSSYWGNFEREFIAYSIGILDDVQMRIKHSEEELIMFWNEVFNYRPLTFEEALRNYELLKDYLFETFQDVDDWEQLTFYQIDWKAYHREKRNVLRIQLAKPLDEYWESIIIPRMKMFFSKKVYEYMPSDTELTNISLLDSKGNVVKEYYYEH
jgi:hypothetical protein